MNIIDEIKALMKSGDIAEADALCRKTLEADPDNATVQILFAACRKLFGDEESFQNAMGKLIPKMEDIVQKDPESEAAKLWRKAGSTLVDFLVVALIIGILSIGMLYGCPRYDGRMVVQAQYSAEPIPLVGHIRTQVGLYQYEHGRLPFDDAEAGTVTTWRKRDDGLYEPIQFNLNATADCEPVAATNNILSRLEMPLYDMIGRRISPDQIQLACLAPGGVSEDGATTNAYAYAVGVFGSGGEGVPCGTGYAVLEAFFPDVATTKEAGAVETGFKLVATWKDYNKGETTIRFGYAGESGASDEAVCPLIPPEAFAPGAVTKLHGDGPDSVEYWLKRLSDAPCGRWEYSLP